MPTAAQGFLRTWSSISRAASRALARRRARLIEAPAGLGGSRLQQGLGFAHHGAQVGHQLFVGRWIHEMPSA
jgi:hypothetical protein